MRKSHKRKHRTPRIRKKQPPGAAPGTIGTSSDSDITADIEVYSYQQDDYEFYKCQTFEELTGSLKPGYNHWVNVNGLGNESLIAKIGEYFKLHNLSLEDVVATHQRSKAEQYDEYLYVVMRMISSLAEQETQQLSLFVGGNFVVTFQEKPIDCLDPVRDRLKSGTRIRVSATG